ncbi:MAG: hypothetical protein GY801_45910 [bacterium]|nr:hypothetical protein [bacterium]
MNAKKVNIALPREIEDIILVAISRYVLGRLPGEEVPTIALILLEAGVESAEIVELAGMMKPTLSEVDSVFLKALNNLGIQLPNIREATVCLAKEIAHQILAETLSPYDGARKIWWELSNVDGGDERLNIFAGLAGEYEDTFNEVDRKYYEQQILEEARNIADAAFV